ncbi:MAG: adenylosuccinate synthase [bacterium]
MPATAVIGTQWGDEGKGAVADREARVADIVVRFNGGPNAGHTIKHDGKDQCVLHVIPCGILHDHIVSMIGSGVVFSPNRLINDEFTPLINRGVELNPNRLKISKAATLILPSHVALDEAKELALGDKAIGTTKRGIGPAYIDRSDRRAVLAGTLSSTDTLVKKARELIEYHNTLLTKVYDTKPVKTEDILNQLVEDAEVLAPYLADVSWLVRDALTQNKNVLCEGAQGTLLDISFSGCYPYCTSSHPISGSAITGIGFSPHYLTRVIGVTKAYTTRVGGGPFPTEQSNDLGDLIQKIGNEVGASTGRPRRCGWLDLVALQHAISLNGVTELVMTKLDVLSQLSEIHIANGYRINGEVITRYPGESDAEFLTKCEPVYVKLDGWNLDICQMRHWEDLPIQAREYVTFVQNFLRIPIVSVGVGPECGAVIPVPHK